MKTYVTTGLALVAGFGLGAVSIETLYAQAKPPVYVIAEVDVTNNERYMKEYQPKAVEMVKKNGGRLIAAANPKALEGAAPKRVAVQQWESMDQVNKWYNSAEYKENRKIGDKYAKFRLYIVEGR